MARESAYGRLLHFFHTHPRGRIAEIGFFLGIAALIGLSGLWVYRYPNPPLAYLIWLSAACVGAFGLLPQRKPKHAPAPPGRGKRAQIAQQVKASKKEKRKGPPPPVG